MLLGPQTGQSNEDYFAQLERDTWRSILAGFCRVRRGETLVIDEISMLPGRQLEFVEFLFRRLRGRDEPFGGCQVIAVGDFLQLPPVRTNETERYDWAFLSAAWTAAEFKTVVLETVRRQDEAAFVRALSEFRLGHVRGESARLLQTRVKNFPPATLTLAGLHFKDWFKGLHVSPDDFSRNQSPYAFEPEAECPRFLNELIYPAVSPDDADLLQR